MINPFRCGIGIESTESVHLNIFYTSMELVKRVAQTVEISLHRVSIPAQNCAGILQSRGTLKLLS